MADDERPVTQSDSADRSTANPSSDRLVDPTIEDEAVLFTSGQRWSGPLPPPAELIEYNDAVANGAERILSMVERQAGHRMEMEARALDSDHRLARTGQWIGLIVVLAVLVLAGYMAYMGATTAAVAVIGIDLVGLAAVFVLGSLRKRVIHEIHVEDNDLIVG